MCFLNQNAVDADRVQARQQTEGLWKNEWGPQQKEEGAKMLRGPAEGEDWRYPTDGSESSRWQGLFSWPESCHIPLWTCMS